MLDHIAEHRRCALFCRMGSGKTSATLMPLLALQELDEGPALIVAPKRVAKNTWPLEAEKWEQTRHLKIVPIVGNQTERFIAMGSKAQFYTTNYEQIPWLVAHYGKNWPFRTIIADESTRLKSFRLVQGSQRAAALGKVAHRYCNRFIALSGTPSPNGLKDLWGQMHFIDQGARLGRTHQAFTDRWFRPAKSGYGIEPFDFAQQQIQDAIRDVCITIDPADYMPLQKVIEVDVPIVLPPKAREQYTKMERLMFLELEGLLGSHEIEAVNAAARTNKCLQLAAGALYVDDKGAWEPIHDGKLDALESIIEEACGAPVLVAYQFKSDLARIRERFKQARVFDDKRETENAWNRGEIPLMLAHPQSAGHGSNLQEGGNILVDYSSGWDLEGDDQIIERIGPMRQFQSGIDRPVYRYRLIAERTVDVMVKERRESKRSVQDILLSAMKRT